MLYPADTDARRAFLRERGWTQVSFGPERWSHPGYQPATFALSDACRVEVGLDTPHAARQ